MKISKRSNVTSFIAMDVMEKAFARLAQGHDVKRLEVGQPSTAAPRAALEAAKASLETHVHGYTDPLGIPELRQAIADHYKARYGVHVDPGRVVVTAGSSVGFILTFLACFDVGDKIGLSVPFYPAYPNIIEALDLRTTFMRTDASSHFQLTPEHLMAVPNLDGFVVASPANPTGAMLSPDELQALVDFALANDKCMISDEIYHGITFGRPEQSALAYSDDIIVLNSFSKYFSMPGWRVGWMVVPEVLIDPIRRLMQNLYISTHSVSQHAAVAALGATDELRANVDVYRKNRDFLLKALPDMGITDFSPADGAFYIYADVSAFTNDAESFCARMIEEIDVAITPGVDFDRDEGHLFVRISYAGAHETVQAAVERMATWLENQLVN